MLQWSATSRCISSQTLRAPCDSIGFLLFPIRSGCRPHPRQGRASKQADKAQLYYFHSVSIILNHLDFHLYLGISDGSWWSALLNRAIDPALSLSCSSLRFNGCKDSLAHKCTIFLAVLESYFEGSVVVAHGRDRSAKAPGLRSLDSDIGV